MPKTELFLSRVIKYGLYAILLTPLAFWPAVIYPFLTSKFILFQILVEIVFGAWLIALLLNNANNANEYANDANRESKFKLAIRSISKNKIVLALLGFTAISFISAIFGADFWRSFWGIGPRMTGLFGELHFLAWFLVLTSVFNNANNANENERLRMMRIANNENDTNYGLPKNGLAISGISSRFVDWHHYLNFSFFIAIAVAATAFYTNAKWGLVFGYGIFNNPTFLAPYLIFHFFWGLYQTLNLSDSVESPRQSRDKSQISNLEKWPRWVFGVGTLFLLAMVSRAQIRGAILGLVLGIFVFGAGLVFGKIFSRRARILFSTFYILLFLFLVGIWFLRGNPVFQNISPIKRVTGFSFSEYTVQTRLLVWKTALRNMWNRPVLGFGPENFNYFFNANYDPRSLKFGGGGFNETWYDKPHNAFLEILTEVGIIGSIVYILVWIAAAAALLKLFKNGQKLLSVTLISVFVSYFGASFFAFDSFGSWFGLYLMLGLLASHHDPDSTNSHPNNPNKNLNLKKLFGSFGLILIFGSLYINYEIWRAGLADANAIRIFPYNSAQGMDLFKKSLSYQTPYKAEYQLDMLTAVTNALQKRLPIQNLEENLNFAIEEGEEMLEAKSKDAFYFTSMAKLYNIFGELGRDQQIIALAETYGEKALKLSPKRQETLFYLARTSLLKNDAKLAINWTKQAVEANPAIPMSHWFLGVAYLADGQEAAGRDEIKEALALGYDFQNQKEKDLIKNLGL